MHSDIVHLSVLVLESHFRLQVTSSMLQVTGCGMTVSGLLVDSVSGFWLQSGYGEHTNLSGRSWPWGRGPERLNQVCMEMSWKVDKQQVGLPP